MITVHMGSVAIDLQQKSVLRVEAGSSEWRQGAQSGGRSPPAQSSAQTFVAIVSGPLEESGGKQVQFYVSEGPF